MHHNKEALKNLQLVYEKEIEDMQNSLGDGHLVVITLKRLLAEVLSNIGDFDSSERLCRT